MFFKKFDFDPDPEMDLDPDPDPDQDSESPEKSDPEIIFPDQTHCSNLTAHLRQRSR